MKYRIYLDDERTPIDKNWIIVRDYYQFVETVMKIGLPNIDIISLDHDLGDSAIGEYYRSGRHNREIDYSRITEKTGYDCAKWLTDLALDKKEDLPLVYTHSKNPSGCQNIIGIINSFLRFNDLDETCTIASIPHTVNYN